nr:MAG TPA: hypothetical protein [Caudoviricetes sp.]
MPNNNDLHHYDFHCNFSQLYVEPWHIQRRGEHVKKLTKNQLQNATTAKFTPVNFWQHRRANHG